MFTARKAEGAIFTRVCHSVHRGRLACVLGACAHGGIHAWWMRGGGVHGEGGLCVARGGWGTCVVKGHAILGEKCKRAVCILLQCFVGCYLFSYNQSYSLIYIHNTLRM